MLHTVVESVKSQLFVNKYMRCELDFLPIISQEFFWRCGFLKVVLRFGGGVGRLMDVEEDDEGVGVWCGSGRVMRSGSGSGVCGLRTGDGGGESNVTVLVGDVGDVRETGSSMSTC